MPQYRPILAGWTGPNLAAHAPDIGGAYAQGKQIGLARENAKMQKEQFEFQKQVYEEKKAEAERIKLEQENARKKQIAQKALIQNIQDIRRVQASGAAPELVEKVHAQKQQKFMELQKRLGEPAAEFEFPDFGVDRERAMETGVEALRNALNPDTPGVEIPTEGTAAPREQIEQTLSQRIEALQRARQPELGEDFNKAADPISIEAAAQLDAMDPGKEYRVVENAVLDPRFARIRAKIAEEKAKKGPMVGAINLIQGPTTGARTEFQKLQVHEEVLLDDLNEIVTAAGGTWDNEKGKIEGGDFEALFGWGPRAKLSMLELGENLGQLTPEQQAQFQRLDGIRQLVGDLNISEVHKYFGGALTPGEMERSRKIILNPKSTPTQVRNALEKMVKKATRRADLYLRRQDRSSFPARIEGEEQKREGPGLPKTDIPELQKREDETHEEYVERLWKEVGE